jgi:hypothetical protein
MAVEFQPKKLITCVNVGAKAGSFAPDAESLLWENCRERFAKTFTACTTGFYFKHEPGQSPGVAGFIFKTESILKLADYSRFAETNRASVMWAEPAQFWKECQMRRSLLTILLRAGMVYEPEKDNYEEALFRQEYVVPTKRAVLRFLFGFTKYLGPDLSTDGAVQFRGWKSVFDGVAEAELKKMLVWPGPNPYTPHAPLDGLWF